MRQKLVEIKEIEKSTTIVGNFDSLVSVIDRRSRQKISKSIGDLNSTMYLVDLIDIHRALQTMV